MVKILFDKEKPLNSSDEYLLKQYFSEIDKFKDVSISNIILRDYISRGMDKMQEEGIFYDAELDVNVQENTVTVKPTSRMNFRIGATTDLKQEICYNTANPFGKGGVFEFNLEMDLKSLIGKFHYSDKTGNTIMATKTTEKSSYNLKDGFKIDTSSLSWQWKKNRHSFVIKSSDRSVGVDTTNHHKSHLASTGSSYLLSLQHDFNFKKEYYGIYQQFGQVNSEFSLPYLSTVPFIKSKFNFHQILDLPFKMKLFLSHSFGAIYKLGKNNTLTPVPDRFFNGHSFTLEGFRDNSLVGSRGGSPFMGSDLFYTSRISLLKSIRDEAYFLGFYSFGNSTIDYNNCKSGGISKVAINDLFNPKSIRSSIGAGIVFPTHVGLLQFYFVKPLCFYKRDKLNSFGFHATFSM